MTLDEALRERTIAAIQRLGKDLQIKTTDGHVILIDMSEVEVARMDSIIILSGYGG